MLRAVLTYLLPLVAPTLVFLTWVWLRGRYGASHGTEAAPIEKGTWFWLAVAGLLLTGLSLAVTAVVDPGGTPDQMYHPPVVIDGKVVPGQFGAPKQ